MKLRAFASLIAIAFVAATGVAGQRGANAPTAQHRKSVSAFTAAASQLGPGPSWAADWLALAGEDDETLRLFHRQKLPQLPAQWDQFTEVQRQEWLDSVASTAAERMLRIETTDGPRWVWILQVAVGGKVLVEAKEVDGGYRLIVEDPERPKPTNILSPPPPGAKQEKRDPVPRDPPLRLELFIPLEDASHPLLSVRKGVRCPSATFFIPVVFEPLPTAGDYPEVGADCYRGTLMGDDLARFGHRAEVVAWLPDEKGHYKPSKRGYTRIVVGRWRMLGRTAEITNSEPDSHGNGIVLPAVHTSRSLLKSLGVQVPPRSSPVSP